MKTLTMILALALAGCAPQIGEKQEQGSKVGGKLGTLYSGLGRVVEDTTQVTISPTGTVTNIFHKETRTSPAADFAKNVGGMVLKGVK